MSLGRIFVAIEIILLSVTNGCTTAHSPEFVQPDYGRWQQIKVGMSDKEVEALIGKPLERANHDCPGSSSVYIVKYGIIRYDATRFPSPYIFDIIYHCRDHLVVEKNDPFDGKFSSDGSPTVPSLISPYDHQRFDHYPRNTDFRWTPSSGVYPMTYEVQLNWQPEDEWDISTTTSYKTKSPYLAESWVGKNRGVWRVRAINKLGASPWSTVRSFSFSR